MVIKVIKLHLIIMFILLKAWVRSVRGKRKRWNRRQMLQHVMLFHVIIRPTFCCIHPFNYCDIDMFVGGEVKAEEKLCFLSMNPISFFVSSPHYRSGRKTIKKRVQVKRNSTVNHKCVLHFHENLLWPIRICFSLSLSQML